MRLNVKMETLYALDCERNINYCTVKREAHHALYYEKRTNYCERTNNYCERRNASFALL
jgi:hypothetical protein